VEVVSILGLVAIFVIATVLPVHMGPLALVAAFIVGTLVVGESPAQILSGFPDDLFLILVGVTFLFAIASDNGTIDWLVNAAMAGVGRRIALIPWVMFAITALITSVGAASPAAVAIVAPIGLGFAQRHRIEPILMGLMIVNGAAAGGFSPLSVFGSIVNGVVDRNGLPGNPLFLFLSSLAFNTLLSVVVFVLFGGGALWHRGRSESSTVSAALADTDRQGLDRNRILTLIGIAALATAVLFFNVHVGFAAMTVAVLLSLAAPKLTKAAVSKVAWSTVLLICGIVTYVSLMERIGAIDYLGKTVALINAPLLAAALVCYIGGAVSAFASTTGILGALIPLAVPFLLTGEVSAVGLIIALSISSSVVDASPFSTNGALVVANAPREESDRVLRQLMIWGFSMVALAPLVAWLVFVVPGWL
jgi:di/tricarboxylate transporter